MITLLAASMKNMHVYVQMKHVCNAWTYCTNSHRRGSGLTALVLEHGGVPEVPLGLLLHMLVHIHTPIYIYIYPYI
jgi:hypothetical protein